jgi:hypothetical protein
MTKTSLIAALIGALLCFAGAGCTTSTASVKDKPVIFRATIASVVWPYPVLQEYEIDPGKNFIEPHLGAVSLIVLTGIDGDKVTPPPPGYCVALASDMPGEQLYEYVGNSYEFEIFGSFLPTLYAPIDPSPTGWDKPLTDLRQLLSLKKIAAPAQPAKKQAP